MQPESDFERAGASVDEARTLLEALLTQAPTRLALKAGTLFDQVGPHAARALKNVDVEQLERAASLLRRDLLKRRRRGSRPLGEQFAQTLSGVDEEALLLEFVASAHYNSYRELPHGRQGLCIEEAFFRFLEEAQVGGSDVRRLEYLSAAATAILLHPSPAFSLPAPFRRQGAAFVAVGPGPTLFAVVGSRLITGPITDLLAGMVAGDGTRPEGMPHEVWMAARDRLEALGICLREEKKSMDPAM